MTAGTHDMTGAPGGPRPLSGRRALVTGGGRGVGAAITLALAAAGADTGITYVRDEVAEAVLFLVTAGYVNDQRVTVDGGAS